MCLSAPFRTLVVLPATGPDFSSACKNLQVSLTVWTVVHLFNNTNKKRGHCIVYRVYKTSVSNVSEERAALVHPRFQSSCGDLVFFTARRKIKEVCQSFPTLLFHLNTIHVLVAAVLTWHARPLPCQTLHLYRLRSALLERWFQTNPPVPVEKQSVFTRFTAGLTDMTVEGNCTFFFFLQS